MMFPLLLVTFLSIIIYSITTLLYNEHSTTFLSSKVIIFLQQLNNSFQLETKHVGNPNTLAAWDYTKVHKKIKAYFTNL